MFRVDQRLHARRSCFVSLLLAGVMLASLGCAAQQKTHRDEAEQHWNEVRAKVKFQLARQRYESGLVDESLGALSEALALDPQCGAYRLLEARCLLEQGKVAAARRSLKVAEALGLDTSEFAYVRGIIAERRHQLDAALEYYHQARLGDDATVDYLISEAECLVALRRPQEAAYLLESHLIDYDNDPTILALAGEIALLLGDERRAAELFETVLASEDFDPVVAEQYALLMVRLGNHAEALAVLEPLLGRDDQKAPASVLRAAAKCMLALDRPEAAKMTLKSLIQRDPTDVQSWALLARAGIRTGDRATLRRSAGRLRRLAPTAPQSMLIDAYASLIEDDLAGALTALEGILAENPYDVLAHCLMGHVAERAGALRTAREHYRRALQIEPGCRWAQMVLSDLDDQSRDVVSMALPQPIGERP